ncbi:eCIS core domain-containing protein [Labedaea rhizosphaerae]|uniref:Uncharacterized protein DUF4157 n=1 Tax=Labedaea rhizosphaerae TaxID=598644 RepID=A0A4R6SFJ8_LABRH|nr:DUF4157 domain-containing protein [Labedaea rhizosphaerae]TDQ00792.1 uncharacterized protein DUF4157 [Labedaea rhizosphaerae]
MMIRWPWRRPRPKATESAAPAPVKSTVDHSGGSGGRYRPAWRSLPPLHTSVSEAAPLTLSRAPISVVQRLRVADVRAGAAPLFPGRVKGIVTATPVGRDLVDLPLRRPVDRPEADSQAGEFVDEPGLDEPWFDVGAEVVEVAPERDLPELVTPADLAPPPVRAVVVEPASPSPSLIVAAVPPPQLPETPELPSRYLHITYRQQDMQLAEMYEEANETPPPEPNTYQRTAPVEYVAPAAPVVADLADTFEAASQPPDVAPPTPRRRPSLAESRRAGIRIKPRKPHVEGADAAPASTDSPDAPGSPDSPGEAAPGEPEPLVMQAPVVVDRPQETEAVPVEVAQGRTHEDPPVPAPLPFVEHAVAEPARPALEPPAVVDEPDETPAPSRLIAPTTTQVVPAVVPVSRDAGQPMAELGDPVVAAPPEGPTDLPVAERPVVAPIRSSDVVVPEPVVDQENQVRPEIVSGTEKSVGEPVVPTRLIEPVSAQAADAPEDRGRVADGPATGHREVVVPAAGDRVEPLPLAGPVAAQGKPVPADRPQPADGPMPARGSVADPVVSARLIEPVPAPSTPVAAEERTDLVVPARVVEPVRHDRTEDEPGRAEPVTESVEPVAAPLSGNPADVSDDHGPEAEPEPADVGSDAPAGPARLVGPVATASHGRSEDRAERAAEEPVVERPDAAAPVVATKVVEPVAAQGNPLPLPVVRDGRRGAEAPVDGSGEPVVAARLIEPVPAQDHPIAVADNRGPATEKSAPWAGSGELIVPARVVEPALPKEARPAVDEPVADRRPTGSSDVVASGRLIEPVAAAPQGDPVEMPGRAVVTPVSVASPPRALGADHVAPQGTEGGLPLAVRPVEADRGSAAQGGLSEIVAEISEPHPGGGLDLTTTPQLAPTAIAAMGAALGRAATSIVESVAPPALVAPMRRALGVDIADVPVRRGAPVSVTANRLRARAFTAGGVVHLPDSAGAMDSGHAAPLLAHELTHAAQQRHFGVTLPGLETTTGKQLEAEAVAVEQWVAGGSVGAPPVVSGHGGRVQLADEDDEASTSKEDSEEDEEDNEDADVEKKAESGGEWSFEVPDDVIPGAGPGGMWGMFANAVPGFEKPELSDDMPDLSDLSPAGLQQMFARTAGSGGPGGPGGPGGLGGPGGPGGPVVGPKKGGGTAPVPAGNTPADLVAAIVDAIADRPPRRWLDLDDLDHYDEIAQRIYNTLQSRLRYDVLLERERSGTLMDFG